MSKERQKHGFDYENIIINKYGLVKNGDYTGYCDAYYQNIPIQIKCIKLKSSIDMGDYIRNKHKTNDFILHIGFWENDRCNIVEEYTIYIGYKEWVNLFRFPHDDEMFEDLSHINNDKSDDDKFKEYIKKYRSLWKDNNNRYVQLRFKRDHKSQKRIQCAINNKDFYNYFIKNFKSFNIEPLIMPRDDKQPSTKPMKSSQDKFYTKKETVEILLSQVDFCSYDLIIEPSAGSGNISLPISQRINQETTQLMSCDIEPEDPTIKKMDYLNESLEIEGFHRVLVIGNPPFGRQSSQAVKFFNRSAQYPQVDTILFILPQSFRKPSIQNRLSRNFILEKELEIPRNSFTLNNQDYSLPCIIQKWIRTENPRLLYPKYRPNNLYVFTTPHPQLIALRRVGYYAGKAHIIEGNYPSCSSHYFIESSVIPKDFIVTQLNNISWKFDNVVGARSISKNEFILALNQITERYTEK